MAPRRVARRHLAAAPAWIPAVVLVLLFLVPLCYIGAYSVGLLRFPPSSEAGIDLSGWTGIFSSSIYLDLFLRSVTVAAVVATLVVGLAYPVAYFLALIVTKRRYALLLLVLAPFFTSFLLRVFAWKVILGANGVVNSVAYELGLRAEGDPISFLLYSRVAVIIVLVYVWLPFAVLPIYSSLESIDGRLMEAASDLGASGAQGFRKVTLPLSLPGVGAAFVLVFVPSLGEFVTPQLVGGANGFMYGNALQELFTTALDWKTGSVLTMFLLLAVLLAAVVAKTISALTGGRPRAAHG